MKIYLKTIFLFFSLSIAFNSIGQEAPNKMDASGKKQGHWIKLDADKKKMYDGNFVSDVPTGKFTYYYPTGEIKAVTVFSKNGTIARTQIFTAGGKLMGEGKYISEKKDSLWKFYDEEGVLISEENYLNGNKEGKSKLYYRNGQLAEERNYKGGEMDGPRLKYFEDGQIKYKGQYINGKVEGKVTFYYSSGKVDAEGVYKNDLKDGDWHYYTEDGKPKRTDTYQNGRMTSPNPNIIKSEDEEKEKKQYEGLDLKDPFDQSGPN
jgi:antitoxin component YwqK of YwqJK toxin-antitoxin module